MTSYKYFKFCIKIHTQEITKSKDECLKEIIVANFLICRLKKYQPNIKNEQRIKANRGKEVRMILKHEEMNNLTQNKKNAIKIMIRYHFSPTRQEI